MIESTVAAVHEIAKNKFPAADVYVQSVLPRVSAGMTISQKIKDINQSLSDRLGVYFLDLTEEFVTRKGKTKKDLFRPDGLHLSGEGCDRLASKLLRFDNDKQWMNNDRTSTITVHGENSWSLKYEKKSMTFEALLGEGRTKVLIDTGSFVTLIDKRLLAGLADAKKVDTTLKLIEGIGGLTKEIEGATIIKIKIGKHELPLKCHIVHNMAFPIVLGRDMMNITMIAVDHRESKIYFKKDISIKEIENAGTATCMLNEDVILEPNAVNQVEVQIDQDSMVEGNLFTSREAQQKGLWLAHTKLPTDNIFRIHNLNKTKVKLEKHTVIAQISPVNKALPCWATFKADSMENEGRNIQHEQQRDHQQEQQQVSVQDQQEPVQDLQGNSNSAKEELESHEKEEAEEKADKTEITGHNLQGKPLQDFTQRLEQQLQQQQERQQEQQPEKIQKGDSGPSHHNNGSRKKRKNKNKNNKEPQRKNKELLNRKAEEKRIQLGDLVMWMMN